MFASPRFTNNTLRTALRFAAARQSGQETSKLNIAPQCQSVARSRPYHAVNLVNNQQLSKLTQNRFYSDSSISSVSGVIEHIKNTANADIVKKVNATYIFDVGKDGELKPATAYMSGKLKLSGDMTKAMKLETLMKANYSTWNRQIRSFSTEAPPDKYESVEHVFERLKMIASPDIVKKVQAVFLFDVQEKGKYFLDFKTGDGKVGHGDPQGKADVTISMNNDNFLKIFNREVSPATAFMTGKIKVKGDLSKALTLEKVMVAAREAAVKSAQK